MSSPFFPSRGLTNIIILPLGIKNFGEDNEDQDDEGPDDSDVAVAAVIQADVATSAKAVLHGSQQSREAVCVLQDLLKILKPAPSQCPTRKTTMEKREGKRARKKNRRYLGWLQHDDEDGSDVVEHELVGGAWGFAKEYHIICQLSINGCIFLVL
ncbi:hypothetical protein K438DRAFT_1783140 [Mycena galopus ATCC 62051]|nr:hypothetical protein K438DRAFT_1783140 [Mycena galopus ATCC 62051]